MDAAGSERAALLGLSEGAPISMLFAATYPERPPAPALAIAVATGARIASLGSAGDVLVAATVRDLVAGSGIAFEDWGSHTLKGLPEERRVYVVTSV